MNGLETWVCLLGAPRIVSHGGVPDVPGGGAHGLQDTALATEWAKEDGYESRGAVEAALDDVNRLDGTTLSRLAWQVGQAVFLAGLLHRRDGQLFLATTFYRVATAAAVVARNSFSDWSEYYAAYLLGAQRELEDSQVQRLGQCVERLLGPAGPCRGAAWTHFPQRLPVFRAFAFSAFVRCGECARLTRVGRAGGQAACEYCRSPVRVPEPTPLLSAATKSLLDRLPGMQGGLWALSAEPLGAALCGAEPSAVSCRNCNAELDLSLLETTPSSTSLECKGCSTHQTVRRLGSRERAALLGVEWLLGEHDAAAPVPASGIVVSCDHCGAALAPGDVNSAMWICAYCSGVTQLPLAVLQAQRPAPSLLSLFAVARAAPRS